MRFLADESCDFAIVRALRGAGLVEKHGSRLSKCFVVAQPGRVRIIPTRLT